MSTDAAPHEDFVGRRAELEVLGSAITVASGGRPGTVLIDGDAGIGKTTLVSECALRADVPLYLARSTHLGGDAIPLAPLADLLRQVRRAQPELLRTSTEWAPLRQWFAPESPAVEQAVAQGALFGSMLDLLGALGGESGAVVAFEDLHWADTVTWDLFAHLARNMLDERVVLVGTFRSNEVASQPAQRRRLGEMGRIAGVRRIELTGLARDEIEVRIASLTGGAIPPGLLDRVVARGMGNPFFTRELVEAHLAGEDIPIVLSDLVSSELADVDGDERRVLEVVASLGRPTTHAMLAAVLEVPARDLEPAVRRLIDARILVTDRPSDAYRFRHPLLGEVLYADLLPPQRARLHGRIAAVLGHEDDVRRRADRAGELAFHLDQAGERERALRAFLDAADAAELVAPASALRHLERAFELWDSIDEALAPTDRVDRTWQAAELATSTVGNPRAVDFARTAFALGTPSRGAAWGHERLGRYLWSSGRLEECAVEFARAAEALREPGTAADSAVRAGLGQAALMAGDYDAAERWCRDVLGRVRSADDDGAAWVMARRVLGIVTSTQGDPDGGVALCREAVAAARGAQSRTLAMLYLSVALTDAGDYEAAMRTAFDAVAEGLLTGLDPGFGCYFDSIAAESLMRLGRWSEAEAAIERHPVPNTLPVGLLRYARVRAMLAARRGEAQEALDALDQASALPLDGWHRSVLDATAADVQLILGRWHDARSAAEHGLHPTGPGSLLWSARFTMLHACAAVELVLDARAQRGPDDATDTVGLIQARVADIRASFEAGSREPQRDTAAHLAHATATLTRLGAPDPDAWSRAIEQWRALGDVWFTAVASVRLAEVAVACGQADRAASALREAHEVATRLGARSLLAEIDLVSRRTRLSVDAPTRVLLQPGASERLGLTAREAEVLGLLAAGRTNRQIGEELFVSEKTASVHVSNILRKLGVTTRIDAAAVAQRLGIA